MFLSMESSIHSGSTAMTEFIWIWLSEMQRLPAELSCFNVLSTVSQFSVKMNQYGFLDGYRFVEITGEPNESSS